MEAGAGKLRFTPQDVLKLILRYLDGFNVSRLYRTGSLSLIRTMHYSLEDFTLVFKSVARPVKQFKVLKFPQNFILRFSSLKSLSVTLNEEYCIDNLNWSTMPRNIQSFTLICVNAWKILYDPTIPILPVDILRSEHPRHTNEVVDLSAIFPNLKELIIRNWQTTSPSPSINDSIVKSLPSTVTYFEHPWYLRFTDDGISRLPPNLRILAIRDFQLVTESSLGLLPQHLIRLFLHHDKMTNELCGQLAPTLEILNLKSSQLTQDCVALLPKSLISLRIEYRTTSEDAKAHCFFPPTLTFLSCGRSIHFQDDDLIHLPKNLQTLILGESVTLSDDGLPLLPQTLTHLDLSIGKNFSNRGVPKLPRKLKALALSTNKITGDSADLLPPELTSLALPNCQYIEDDQVILFPRTIRSLNLRTSHLTPACIPFLPPNLEQLLVSDPILSTSFAKKETASVAVNKDKQSGGCQIQ